MHGRRTDLETLAKAVEDRQGDDLGRLWDQFHEHRASCRRLFREYLAFLEGALVRSAGLDGGACDVADGLLQELWQRIFQEEWPRFTILAEDEFLAGTTDIIRLRFPHLGVWNLPVAAHELGHYVASKLEDPETRRPPVIDLIEAVQRQLAADLESMHDDRRDLEVEAAGFHLHELFADLFAVYTLGPSYACTCILLRFDPRGSGGGEALLGPEGSRHPSDRYRAHTILRALERIAPDYYRPVTERLRETWRRSVIAAGNAEPFGRRETRAWLDEVLDRMMAVLERDLLREARYFGWRAADDLRDRLLAGTKREAGSGCSLTDLLNAAWLCRLEGKDVGGKALQLALDIARGAGETHDE